MQVGYKTAITKEFKQGQPVIYTMDRETRNEVCYTQFAKRGEIKAWQSKNSSVAKRKAAELAERAECNARIARKFRKE